MKSYCLGPLLLTLVLSLFVSPLSAAIPTFWVDPATSQNTRDRFYAGWKECIRMARVAVTTWEGRCDPVYQRYFEDNARGADLVIRMFKSIAGFDIDEELTPANFRQILTGDAFLNSAPKFSGLHVALNEPTWTPEHYKGTCAEDDGFGSFILRPDREDATVVLCPSTVQYPLISEVLAPPASANDAQGNLLPGYGCNNLLDRDTEYMREYFRQPVSGHPDFHCPPFFRYSSSRLTIAETIGGYFLHELIHWSYLFDDIRPEWELLIVPAPGHEDDVYLISDYEPPAVNPPAGSPPDGYGPYRTALLKQNGVMNPDERNPFPALNNADNYMW